MENLALKLTTTSFVFKFVPKVTWNGFILKNENIFRGYGNDIRDGFVHLATHEQLYRTFISKHSEKEKCDFKLLAIDINTAENIKWEKAKNGLIYPHAYSGLNIKRDILWIIDMDNYVFDCNGI